MRRALLSTANKTGLVDFAKQLAALDFTLLATGGTADLLRQNGLAILDVSDYTGFPEIMNGRVKTLHPKIHGALLARPAQDEAVMLEQGIEAIDLVVVNLYPFEQTIAKPNCPWEDAIEQIDIGGPTMLRSAAKNHQHVTVVVDPKDYATVIDEIRDQGTTELKTRRELAAKVFAHTAHYDTVIADYFATQTNTSPEHYAISLTKSNELRYGENPHQRATLYRYREDDPGTLAHAKLLQGKPLSFNNLMDSDAALNCVRALAQGIPACVIVKHATPCGVAQAAQLHEAYQLAYATDPTSCFGGIIAVNQVLDAQTAQAIVDQQFTEVILAPDYAPEALSILSQKKNLRVLHCGQAQAQSLQTLHSITGGVLIQDADLAPTLIGNFQVVTKRQPTTDELQDLSFAWEVVRFVKSNAIVYAKNGATVGIGTGQTSRVFSAKIALEKATEANLNVTGAVMASDAFFPFADGLEVAANAGITAVIQPGGSKRDDEVIAAADAANIAMIFTGQRHFRH